MNSLSLKAELARLRSKYTAWKAVHPELQNEEMINQFLLLKARFKTEGIAFKDINSPLDRDSKSLQDLSIIPEVPTSHHFAQPFAPVRPSGKIDGKTICLDDFLPYLKDFIIASPTSWIVGGAAEHDNTRGDLDMLHMLPTTKEISRIIDFRIFRMLPPHLAERIHSLWESRGARSPFTAFLPLYRLRCERIPRAQIVPMSEQESLLGQEHELKPSPFSPSWPGESPPPSSSGPSFSEIHLRTKGTEKQEREANEAAKNDQITFGEFFVPQKPTRGYVSGQAQTLEFFLSLWKDEQFPVYSSRKADGINSIWHISKAGKVVMYTEDGSNETSSFPVTILESKKLAPGHDIILLAEVEWWQKGHFPREYTAGKVHQIQPDEEGIVVNVYDIVYFDGDIHKKPFEERQELAKGLKFLQRSETPSPKFKWNLIPNIRNKDRKALEKETQRLRAIPGSEGNVAKQASASYDLTGSRPMSWIKFHNSSQFTAIVIEAVETKTKGTFNLKWGLLPGNLAVKESILRKIKGKDIALGGKTFAITEEAMGRRGDHILIECETFNLIFDMKSKTYDISAWAPRCLGKSDKEVDSIKSVKKRAISDHVYQGKVIDGNGKVHYLPGGMSGEEWQSK